MAKGNRKGSVACERGSACRVRFSQLSLGGHHSVLRTIRFSLRGVGAPPQSRTLPRKHAPTGPNLPLPLTCCRTLEERLGLSEPQFPPLGNGVLGGSLVKIQWLDIQ